MKFTYTGSVPLELETVFGGAGGKVHPLIAKNQHQHESHSTNPGMWSRMIDYTQLQNAYLNSDCAVYFMDVRSVQYAETTLDYFAMEMKQNVAEAHLWTLPKLVVMSDDVQDKEALKALLTKCKELGFTFVPNFEVFAQIFDASVNSLNLKPLEEATAEEGETTETTSVAAEKKSVNDATAMFELLQKSAKTDAHSDHVVADSDVQNNETNKGGLINKIKNLLFKQKQTAIVA